MIVLITFLVIIKRIPKWAENILSRNKLVGKKNTISKQELRDKLPYFEAISNKLGKILVQKLLFRHSQGILLFLKII